MGWPSQIPFLLTGGKGSRGHSGCGSVFCRTSANTKTRKSVLAEALQTQKWGKVSLQKFCKRQNEGKRPCRSPANAKMGKSVLAEVLQTPKWGKASLQNFCKVQNGEKCPCRSPENAKMGKSVLAGTLHREPIYLNGRMLPIM